MAAMIDTTTLMSRAEQTSTDPISDDRLLVYAIRLWQENPEARKRLKAATIDIMLDMGLVELGKAES